MAGTSYIHTSRGGIEYALLRRDEKGNYLQPFLRHKVIDNDENAIIDVDGRPRIGKSNVSIALAEGLRQYGFHFPDDTTHICMGTLEFINLLQTKPPRWSVIIYEEAPVTHNTRQWHSIENEMLNRILNTFGFMNYVVILNGVNFNDLDKQARKLVHMELNCVAKDTRGKTVSVRPKWVSYSSKSDKFYYTNVLAEHGKMGVIKFGKCTKNIWGSYQEKKFKWNYDALDDMKKDLRMIAAKKEVQKREIDVDGIVAKIKEAPEKYKTVARIAASFAIPYHRARMVQQRAIIDE